MYRQQLMNNSRIIRFIYPKIKFAATSAVATSVDYLLFFLIIYAATQRYIILAQIVAYSAGLITNFLLQKKFIFELRRTTFSTFQLSVSFSLVGLGLSTLFLYLLTQMAFFREHLILAKILITAVIFFYNFYTKRFAFEKRGILSGSEAKI